MPLPQWMQTAGQNWQQGGGVGGLMQNPWFQMGQSIGRGGSPTQGYMQAQDLQGRNMQLQQMIAAREQQKKLQQLLDKIRKGGQAQQQVQGQPQPGAFSGVLNMPGSQLPPPGTQGPMAIPQTFGAQPGVQTLQGGQPPFTRTPSSQARQGDAGGQYRQMLEAYAQYGTPNEQMQALGLLMKPPAQRRIAKDQAGVQRYLDTQERVFPGSSQKHRGLDTLKFERGLRKDLAAEEKDFEASFMAAEKAFALLEEGSSTSDYGALISYIKSLDPTSVVREGEVALLEAIQPYIQRAKQLANKLEGDNGYLSDDMRAGMKEAIIAITSISKQSYDNLRADYQGMLSGDSDIINVESIMGRPYPVPDKIYNKEYTNLPGVN